MKTYIINLKKDTDKIELLSDSIPNCIKNFNVFEAIDGLSKDLPEWWASNSYGAYGCYLSHLALMENINDTSLILEDDAIFANNFCEKYKYVYNDVLPKINFDIFYLGGRHRLCPRPQFTHNNYVKCRYTTRTHAYIINIKSKNKILKLLKNKFSWNTFANRYHIDHFYGNLCLNNLITCYAIKPFIVGQRATLVSSVSPNVGSLPERWGNNNNEGNY